MAKSLLVKRRCRETIGFSSRRRERVWTALFRHARIITDPKKLAQLNAEVEKRKQYGETNGGESR